MAAPYTWSRVVGFCSCWARAWMNPFRVGGFGAFAAAVDLADAGRFGLGNFAGGAPPLAMFASGNCRARGLSITAVLVQCSLYR